MIVVCILFCKIKYVIDDSGFVWVLFIIIDSILVGIGVDFNLFFVIFVFIY